MKISMTATSKAKGQALIRSRTILHISIIHKVLVLVLKTTVLHPGN